MSAHSIVIRRGVHEKTKITTSGSWALPGIILIFLFGYLPLFGLVIAFKNVDYSKGIWASDWVGLKNFEFFFKSNDALRVTRNTLVMNALFIVFTLIVSVSVAIMLYYVAEECSG